MPFYGARIRNVVAGDDFGVERTVSDLVAGTSCTKAWMTVKTVATDADVNAKFQKVITTTNVNGVGQIEDNGATTTEVSLRFDCTRSDTILLTPGVAYFYDIQILLSTGEIYTPETGTFTTIQGVTIAVT